MKRERTHCTQGHELIESNVYIKVRNRRGRTEVERICKQCEKNRRVYVGGGFKIARKVGRPPRVIGLTQQQYVQNFRRKAFDKLGNKCNSCGFSDFRVLQIHHKNGDGKDERKILKATGIVLCKFVIEDQYDRYELLCSNCHILKHRDEKDGRV